MSSPALIRRRAAAEDNRIADGDIGDHLCAVAHSSPPVISRSFAKNAFLRGELMPQSTGTLW